MERIGVLQNESTLSLVLTPVVFFGVFVLAELLYRWVEEPARRALRRLMDRRPTRSTPPALPAGRGY
jgi:peptidoglycan/LPS O-acetylase OafA/YrhL